MYGDPFLAGYEQVYQISSGGYEWAEFRAAFKKDGRLFSADASGCSCTDYEEQVSERDLVELPTLESAKNAVKSFLDDAGRWYFEGDTISRYLDAVEKFRELGLR